MVSDDLDLLALAEKSSANDLAFLIRAKEDTKRLMKQSPTRDNITAFNRAKVAVADEVARLQGGGATMKVLKTQLDAVEFLQNQGFKVSKSKFGRDVNDGKVATTVEGFFEDGALLAYASLHLTPLAKAENRALTDATVNRVSADADLKRLTAERTRLKLEKEQGLLMPRAQYEEDLAARAMFFKSEVDSFGFRKAGEIITLVNGDERRMADLLKWWAAETADWMDAWSSEREFVAAEQDEPQGQNGDD